MKILSYSITNDLCVFHVELRGRSVRSEVKVFQTVGGFYQIEDVKDFYSGAHSEFGRYAIVDVLVALNENLRRPQSP